MCEKLHDNQKSQERQLTGLRSFAQHVEQFLDQLGGGATAPDDSRQTLRLEGNRTSVPQGYVPGVSKMYHVTSVKQTLREDLAEHSNQFSHRAADWSRSAFCSVPMQIEPLELHVVDALGQQEVHDYFQQPAKAITEDVSVMRVRML